MICASCGAENIADAVYCAFCGSFVRKGKSIDSNELVKPRQEIQRIIEQRKDTDRILNPWLVVLPFIFLILLTTVMIFGVLVDVMKAIDRNDATYEFSDSYVNMITWLAIFSCGLYIILGTITYFQNERMNEHSKRENDLRVAVSAYFKVLDDTPRPEPARSPWSYSQEDEILTPDAIKHHSSILWMMIIMSPMCVFIIEIVALNSLDPDTILLMILLVPISLIQMILMIFMFYFMMNEIYYHDLRWNNFARAVKVRFARAGLTAGDLPEERLMVDRSFGLYLLLSFVLGSVFMIYWWYTILKDPNDHFKKQWRFEDALLQYIGSGTRNRY